MKFAKFLFVSALMAFATGCGTGGGTLNLEVAQNTAAGGGSAKSLFRQWQETGNLFQIDLRSSQFGVSSNVTITTITNQNCTCQVLIQGTNSAGQATFSNCAGTYANCSSFNSTGGAGTYTNNGTTLQVCTTANSCDTFN